MCWAGIVALLRDRFNANEILVSLMLVYVADMVLNYLVYGPWKDPQGLAVSYPLGNMQIETREHRVRSDYGAGHRRRGMLLTHDRRLPSLEGCHAEGRLHHGPQDRGPVAGSRRLITRPREPADCFCSRLQRHRGVSLPDACASGLGGRPSKIETFAR